MHAAQVIGSNRIDFTVLNFRPVDGGTYLPKTLETAFRYFQFGDHPSYFVQSKAWLQGSGRVDLAHSAGHMVKFDNPVDFRYKFWIKHFPIRSVSHGRKKLYRERESRWCEQEIEKGWHVHYNDLDKDASFIWPAEQLREYRDDRFYKDYGLTVMTALSGWTRTRDDPQALPMLWHHAGDEAGLAALRAEVAAGDQKVAAGQSRLAGVEGEIAT
jgi:hypothetical protein